MSQSVPLCGAKTANRRPKARSKLMNLVTKTTMCKFYQSGRCAKGSSCTFAHSEQDLQAPPDLFKTSLCSKFMRKGFCKSGDGCKYAHGSAELRPPGAGEGDPETKNSDAATDSFSEVYGLDASPEESSSSSNRVFFPDDSSDGSGSGSVRVRNTFLEFAETEVVVRRSSSEPDLQIYRC
ncbi:unnamed protein product [Effrenium voratum]|nr:unnamed protein product [Effrenium voratum]